MSHLGGHWPGGDPAAWYPHLWDWFVRDLGVRSVIDVGCGEGQALAYFRDELGCDVLGVDGLEFEDRDTFVHDFTKGPLTPGVRYDLCWSCEFVEHVEERFIENFMETFRSADLLAITHAIPNQGGHHHVNERAPGYWLDRIQAGGFKLDPSLTHDARLYSRCNNHRANYFARTGLVFRRQP